MKKKLLLWSAVAVTSIFFILALFATPQQEAMRAFMRQKLDYSRNILEGITLEKFDLVITNASLLRNMNQTNTFLVSNNPDYARNMSKFQREVDTLLTAAKKNDLDDSTKAYLEVARSCVECHRQFRREQFIKHQ